MRKKLASLLLLVVVITLPSCALQGKFGPANETVSIPIISGSEISRTPPGVEIRFEAVVVNRFGQTCIELYRPDNFTEHGSDPKWAISSTLGFELGIFEALPNESRAIVTGKYIFVKDVQNGSCGIVTGDLFKISGIEYF